MRHSILTLAAAGVILSAAPALAHGQGAGAGRGYAPRDDSNSYWLDYKTDISEAKRELTSDMRRAKTPQDRREAQAEYRREIADAKKDYAKQMLDKGYLDGVVTLDGEEGDD